MKFISGAVEKIGEVLVLSSGVRLEEDGSGRPMVVGAGSGVTIDASWNFDTTTASANPGTKKFRLNNATLASVTAIYVNDTDNEGMDVSTIIGFLASGNRMYVQQKNDATRAAVFQASGAATDNVGWWTIPVTVVNSATIYQNAAECGFVISFTAAGGSGAPTGAKYIVQEGDAGLSAEQSLGALATGIVKNTTTTGVGVLSIAVGADLPAHNHAAADINSGVIAVARLGTGTPDGTKFLRDDGTFVTPASGGAPTTAKYIVQTADAGLSAEQSLGLLTTGLLLNTVTAGTGVLSTAAAGTDYVAPARTISTTAPITGGGDLSTNRTFAISTNGIDDTLLRQGAAASIVGRSAATLGNVADIASAADGDVLRRSGTTLGWGAIPQASVTGLVTALSGKVATTVSISTTSPITGGGDLSTNRTFALAANGISNALFRQGTALTVVGRSANSTGDVADIAAGVDGDVLRRSGTTLGFGAIPQASVTSLVSDLALKAPLASPTFTGTPAAPTAAGGTNTTQVATTAFVAGEITTASSNYVPTARTISTTAPIAGGGDLSANRTFSLNANGITNALFRQGTALTVVGRSANTTGDVADIAAGVDGDVLRRSGTTLGFGAIPQASVTNLVSDLAGKLNLTGGTLTGNLLFTDNTYDIGATGATRPRTGYFGTSLVVGTDPTGSAILRVGGDVRIGTLGVFNGGVSAPTADQFLTFDSATSKWIPKTTQLNFANGEVASGVVDPATAVNYVNDGRAVDDVPSPASMAGLSPVLTPVYKGFIVDVSVYSLPADKVYRVQYAKVLVTQATATSAGSTTTINNSGASYGTTQYVGKQVYIVSGPSAGEFQTISSHTNTQLTTAAFSAASTTSTVFQITDLFVTVCDTTATRLVHSGHTITPTTYYNYRFCSKGATTGTFSNIVTGLPSSVAEVNAFGIITAAQLSVSKLSAISTVIGSVTAESIVVQNSLTTNTLASGDTKLTNLQVSATGTSFGNPVNKILVSGADATLKVQGLVGESNGATTAATLGNHSVVIGTLTPRLATTSGGSWTSNAPSIQAGQNAWSTATDTPTITANTDLPAYNDIYEVTASLTYTDNALNASGYVNSLGEVSVQWYKNGSPYGSPDVYQTEEQTGSPESVIIQKAISAVSPAITSVGVVLTYRARINCTKINSGDHTLTGSGTNIGWSSLAGSNFTRRSLYLAGDVSKPHLTLKPITGTLPTTSNTVPGEFWYDGTNHQFSFNANDTIVSIGASKLSLGSATLLTLPTPVVLPAGTASASTAPLKFTSGTLLTTAEDGALEFDNNCFYGTTDAGNRGVIPVRHFIRANAVRTLPNDLNLNAIFNSPTNGRLTLETGTYLFEMVIGITAMSATSGNATLDVLGAGTATVGDWLYAVVGKDGTLVSVGALTGVMPVIKSTPASMFTAGTGAEMWWTAQGTFTVTVAGTLIPSVDQVTAAAATVNIGSYFSCERIGDTSVVSVGQWD